MLCFRLFGVFLVPSKWMKQYANVALQIGSSLSFRVHPPNLWNQHAVGNATLRCLEKVPYIFSRINGGLMVMNPMGSQSIKKHHTKTYPGNWNILLAYHQALPPSNPSLVWDWWSFCHEIPSAETNIHSTCWWLEDDPFSIFARIPSLKRTNKKAWNVTFSDPERNSHFPVPSTFFVQGVNSRGCIRHDLRSSSPQKNQHFFSKDSFRSATIHSRTFEIAFWTSISVVGLNFHMGVSKNRGTPKWMV